MAKKTSQTLGKNVAYEMDGDVLVIRIDTSLEFGPSKSGKTICVASTEGNKSIGDIKVGINAYKYPTTAAPKKAKK